MKSITVTTQRSLNYGAVLQAYALHRVQKELGIDNYLLDVEKTSSKYEKYPEHLSKRTMIVAILNTMWFFHRKEMNRLVSRFNSFVDENINSTDVHDINSLKQNWPKADFYITGSDQVFGLRGEWDAIRTLNFGGESIRRFSYAASLGEYDWNDDEKSVFREILEKYKMVSVREMYAKKYLQTFTEKQINVHIDPVFLLERQKWEEMIREPIIKENYILCYPLIGNDRLQYVLNELKRLTGYKVISIQDIPVKRVKADRYFYDAGPIEYLNLIRYSEFVVTTSFHGTAFSAIFNKPFYTLIKNYKSQRMTGLLNMLGLDSRLYSDDTIISTDPVDFTYCNRVIEMEKKRSIEYLKDIENCVEKEKDNYDNRV